MATKSGMDATGTPIPRGAPPLAADLTAPRLLLVEGDADLRARVQRILAGDYRLDVVDGEQALAAARSAPPDLIITDVLGPRVDGLHLLRSLRRQLRTRAVPVILVSARGGEDSSIEGLAAGADDYLVEPFSARELRARVAARLAASRARRDERIHDRERRAAAELADWQARDELVIELRAMTRLHQLSTRLLERTDLTAVTSEVVESTMSLQGAQFGLIELCGRGGRRSILAARGFAAAVLERDGAAIGELARAAALAAGQRVVVEDVSTDPVFAPHVELAERAGFRALQSMPLFSCDGDVLAVVSTYFTRPHRPPPTDVRLTDLYARHAAEAIERSRATEALRASEERFRRVFELGLVGMAITSPFRGIIEVNQELCRMLGFSRGELLNKSWVELTHPDDLAADAARYEATLAGRIDGFSLEKRWIRKSGEVIHTIMSASCIRGADGSVEYLASLIQDITARKHAEESLRRAAADLAEAQRLSNTGSWSWRPETGEHVWSDELYRIFGLPPDRTPPSRAAGRQVHPDDTARVRRTLARALRAREPFDLQYRIELADSTVKHVRLVGRPASAKETGLEYRGVLMDVTEEKRREAAVDDAQAELERVTRQMAMGEVAAAIAHEINQPLGAIVNNANACVRLLATRTAPDEVGEVMQNIVEDAQRASAIVQHIRALTRTGSLDRTWIAVEDLVRDVLRLAERQIAEGRVVVNTRVAEGLPPLRGSRVQLQQLLLNLVLNAVDAMVVVDDARRLLTIDAHPAALDLAPAIAISVTDVGVGFGVDVAERLFDPFYTSKHQGMGMGLRIGRSIVEAHGGRLRAVSSPGAGATFECLLPLED